MSKMKFNVSRASAKNADDCPCEEAYKLEDWVSDTECYFTWRVELTPEELIAFCNKYRRVVIQTGYLHSGSLWPVGSLTIYDDFIE